MTSKVNIQEEIYEIVHKHEFASGYKGITKDLLTLITTLRKRDIEEVKEVVFSDPTRPMVGIIAQLEAYLDSKIKELK